MSGLSDRVTEIARWCGVAAAFAAVLPVSCVGAFCFVMLAVGG